MSRTVEIRCSDPLRRDALEESARLALAFVSASSKPGRSLEWRKTGLQVSLTSTALHDGCYLPESAQQLFEALLAFGVPIVRRERAVDLAPPAEWADWWNALPKADDTAFEMVLEIV